MSSISWDDAALYRQMTTLPDKTDRALQAVVRYHRPRVEAYAKRNAPWTDRTSNARNGLFATNVIERKKSYAIVLAHSVPYGIWLEVRWSGRLAIINPTIAAEGIETMKTAAQLFDRIFG